MCYKHLVVSIQLVVNHVPGLNNVIADLLSRSHRSTDDFYRLNQLLPDYQLIPVHIDLTYLNEDI